MKKILTLAVVLAAGMASAASIKWSLNTADTVKFDGTSVKGNGTAYVVFLGTDTLESLTYQQVIDSATVGEPFSTSLGKIKLKDVAVDSETGVGNYALYMSFVSGEKTYYNVSTSLYQLKAADVEALLSEGTALPASSFAFSDSKPTTSMSATSASSGGWVAVPEPSTAALALAGLALLLKRRKA